MKAEEDAEDEAYSTFIGAASRHRRRRIPFQASSDSSTLASSKFDSNLEELDSSDEFASRDDEGEEEEEEEEDVAPNYS